MTRDRTMWFPSKIDWWLALVLATAPIFTLAVALAGPVEGRVVAYGITAFQILIYVGLVFPTTYGLDDGYLIVRHGLVRRRIRLDAITEVLPTRNPLSSPALSLDRLRITHGTGLFKSVMISPSDKHGFLSELALRAGLARRDDGLVRS